MHILPKSLFGRLILVLLTGLILAQLISAFILLRDRGQVLYESVRKNLITHTAGIVRLLDSLPAESRLQLVPLLGGTDFNITLSAQPKSNQKPSQETWDTSDVVLNELAKRLPNNSKILVAVKPSIMEQRMPEMHRRHMMDQNSMSGPWAYMHGLHNMARSFHIQVRLQDGSWVIFERQVSEDIFNWPIRLLIALGVLLISAIVISFIGVRSVVRPLHNLRQAVEGLGKDIKQAPLNETGPAEVKDTARAFNTMQRRLKNYIEDRAEILSAVSHDLKTPLTRIRLRTDLMDDDELRIKTQKDLDDMEAMVSSTLDFMRGTETREPSQALDLMALLESIQENVLEAGGKVKLSGQLAEPYTGKHLALKRCLMNLVENAVRYGKEANISVTQSDDEIMISISDKGPGIPEKSLQKVFDPFFRLESSRAQQTGGTGLGLGIARNIARAHGGDLILQNSLNGGLTAQLTLPV
jgi:signal transduction histidine kinase